MKDYNQNKEPSYLMYWDMKNYKNRQCCKNYEKFIKHYDEDSVNISVPQIIFINFYCKFIYSHENMNQSFNPYVFSFK